MRAVAAHMFRTGRLLHKCELDKFQIRELTPFEIASTIQSVNVVSTTLVLQVFDCETDTVNVAASNAGKGPKSKAKDLAPNPVDDSPPSDDNGIEAAFLALPSVEKNTLPRARAPKVAGVSVLAPPAEGYDVLDGLDVEVPDVAESETKSDDDGIALHDVVDLEELKVTIKGPKKPKLGKAEIPYEFNGE